MKLRALFFLALLLPLSGCIEKTVELARKGPDMLDRGRLIKMAEDGDVEAQYMLGKNYCCGLGTFYDNGQALYWWCQAARQEQADAMYEIGRMFANTRGTVGSEIPVDPARAYAYYTLAENRYQKDAGILRKELEKTLTPSQRASANSMIQNWPNIPCEPPSSLKPKPDPTLMIHDPKSGRKN